MQLLIKTLDRKTLQIEIDDSKTVWDLKAQLDISLDNAQPEQKNLIYSGSILSDDDVLKTCIVDMEKPLVLLRKKDTDILVARTTETLLELSEEEEEEEQEQEQEQEMELDEPSEYEEEKYGDVFEYDLSDMKSEMSLSMHQHYSHTEEDYSTVEYDISWNDIIEITDDAAPARGILVVKLESGECELLLFFDFTGIIEHIFNDEQITQFRNLLQQHPHMLTRELLDFERINSSLLIILARNREEFFHMLSKKYGAPKLVKDMSSESDPEMDMDLDMVGDADVDMEDLPTSFIGKKYDKLNPFHTFLSTEWNTLLLLTETFDDNEIEYEMRNIILAHTKLLDAATFLKLLCSIPQNITDDDKNLSITTETGVVPPNDALQYLHYDVEFLSSHRSMSESRQLLCSILTKIAEGSADLMNHIRNNQEEFLQLLIDFTNNNGAHGDGLDNDNEDGDVGEEEDIASGGIYCPPDDMYEVVLSAEDIAAVRRLTNLGYPVALVLQAYIAFDKKEFDIGEFLYRYYDGF